MTEIKDDIEPMSRKEAAAFCRMGVKTFDKMIRPLIRERRFSRRKVQFDKRDIQRAYVKLFGVDIEKAPPAGAAPLTLAEFKRQVRQDRKTEVAGYRAAARRARVRGA